MQKSTKLLLAAASLWPFVYIIIFFLFTFSTMLLGPTMGDAMPPVMIVFFATHFLTMVLILALTVFYIVDVFRNDRVEKDKKVLWAVVIFMGNMIAMPIYWYLFIWKEAAVAVPPPPAQLNSSDRSAWTNEVNASRPKQEQYTPPHQPPDWR
jgi:glucan phosphoethanolaminetransferase (alkaline phosphatase superfamily)